MKRAEAQYIVCNLSTNILKEHIDFSVKVENEELNCHSVFGFTSE